MGLRNAACVWRIGRFAVSGRSGGQRTGEPGSSGQASSRRSGEGTGCEVVQWGPVRVQSGQAHELIDGEGEDTEHQVAEDLLMAPHADVTPAIGILDSAVHAFDCGAFVAAHSLGVAVSGAAPGASLPGTFLLTLLVPAGV